MSCIRLEPFIKAKEYDGEPDILPTWQGKYRVHYQVRRGAGDEHQSSETWLLTNAVNRHLQVKKMVNQFWERLWQAKSNVEESVERSLEALGLIEERVSSSCKRCGRVEAIAQR